MSNTIKLKRGEAINLPALEVGEPAFTTDTKTIYIGSSVGNIMFRPSEEIFTTALKSKLDGIATGAEVNQNAFSNVLVGGTTIVADGKTDTLEFIAGTGISLVPNASTDQLSVALASGVATSGTYKSVTVDTYGRVTAGTNPTTLAGYGITDAASSSHTHTSLPSFVITAQDPSGHEGAQVNWQASSGYTEWVQDVYDSDMRFYCNSGTEKSFNLFNIGGGGAKILVGGWLVYHAGNDGPGSGLDADLLDGMHASSFATLAGAAFTGNVSVAGNVTASKFIGPASALYGISGTTSNWNTHFSECGAHQQNWTETSTGGPTGSWWFIENMRHSNASSTWGRQNAWGWEDNPTELYSRNVSNGVWGSWVRFLHSGNYNSYAPSLTGAGASGTWNINITGSAGSYTNIRAGVTQSAGASTAVTFSPAFADTNYSVSALFQSTASLNGAYISGISNKTTSGFTVITNSSSTTHYINWICVKY